MKVIERFAADQSMSILPTFRERLTEAADVRAVTVDRWSSGSGSSRNLIELSTAPRVTVLYAKEFNTARRPGFWGLTRNQVNRLERADVKWFAVLLLRSSAAGYVLSAAEVRRLIADGSFELSCDGDYKVNEYLDLRSAQRFESLAELLDHVL